MTDLTDFGVDVADPEPDDEDEGDDGDESADEPVYPKGRCPAITSGSRRRCRADVSRMRVTGDLCGTHGRQAHPFRIDDDPETLILVTGDLGVASLEDLDPDDVDFDLPTIREAIEEVTG